MTRGLHICAALVALTACTGVEQAELPVAPAVEYVAALELDAAGRVISGSELAPWPKGQPLPFVARAEVDTTLAGFATNEAHGAPIEGTLRGASSCEPPLPPPIWAALWPANASLREQDPEQIPPLTTSALARRCPELDPQNVHVQIDCIDRRCEPTTRVLEDCELELDLSTCGDRINRAHLWPSSELCLVRSEEDDRTCAVDASYGVKEAPFTIETRALLPAATDVVPEFLRSNGLLIPDLLFYGWVYDFAILEDRVVIAAGDGIQAREVCLGGADFTGSLIALDLETMAPLPTSTVPACLTRIAAIPGEDAFAGIFVEGTNYFLGKFDARGELLLRAPTRAVPGRHRVVDLEILSEDVVVLFNLSTETGKGGDGGNILAIHALDTLREKTQTRFPRGQRWAFAASGVPSELAIADHKNRTIEWWNVDTGTAAAPLALPRPDGLTDDSLLDVIQAGTVHAHGTRDPLLFSFTKTTLLDRDYFFERAADPVTSVTWPLDQELLLTSALVQEQSGYRAVVALYDRRTSRFLPGTFDLGAGIANKMFTDPSGRIWALLPWSGQIARVTPQGMR